MNIHFVFIYPGQTLELYSHFGVFSLLIPYKCPLSMFKTYLLRLLRHPMNKRRDWQIMINIVLIYVIWDFSSTRISDVNVSTWISIHIAVAVPEIRIANQICDCVKAVLCIFRYFELKNPSEVSYHTTIAIYGVFP